MNKIDDSEYAEAWLDDNEDKPQVVNADKSSELQRKSSPKKDALIKSFLTTKKPQTNTAGGVR
jgi:hypothetical protein